MTRWAVAGTGNMARQFLQDCEKIDNGRFVAVYSHDQTRADRFAKAQNLDNGYADFSALLNDDNIDAVYIASTHPHHAPQAIAALEAGKHVLVEKPMALSKQQARLVFESAKRNNCFCAEALWTKFSPNYQALIKNLADGRIGELKHINANFGFSVDMNQPTSRLLSLEHAGGALLDIGLYPIFLPLTLFGMPLETKANIQIGPTGVDIAADLLMSYSHARTATVSYRFDAMMANKATFSGTNGWAEMDSPWHAGDTIIWSENGQPLIQEKTQLKNRGWGQQFESINSAISQGKLQADEHTWQDSLRLAEYLEMLRNTWGPSYPFE